MKHGFICVSSVLINWCWMWSVAFFNDVSSESEWLFTSEICFYHDYYYSFMILGISDEFVFYQFQPFFPLSRQSPPTDWPTLFEVNLVPRAFSFRKWLEDTRLEVTLAQGKGGGGREGRRGYSLVFLVVRMGSPVLHILNLFQTKYALFHTHFQTGSQNTEYW